MPTAISLLFVIAMAGKPIKCDAFSARGNALGGMLYDHAPQTQSDHRPARPDCLARTYGWELLVLPVATASPFVSGFFIARMSADRKERHFKSKGGVNEA